MNIMLKTKAIIPSPINVKNGTAYNPCMNTDKTRHYRTFQDKKRHAKRPSHKQKPQTSPKHNPPKNERGIEPAEYKLTS
jgi:hypothetical protein